MKFTNVFATMAIFLCAATAVRADDYKSTTTTESTTVQGEVVSVDAGKTIVVRKDNGEQVTYQLGSDVAVPAEAQVGKVVVLQMDRPNSTVVKRVTTSSVGPFTKRVEETSIPGTDRTATTTTYTVKGFEPGRTLTLVGPDGKVMTLNIDAQSQIPATIAVGSAVTFDTEDISGRPVARHVVVTKKTTTTTEEKD